MYAVIATGGKQYRVSQGDTVYIEKLNVSEGEVITFDALLTENNGDVRVGHPFVDDAVVTAKAIGLVKGEKIHIYKYKSKKNHHRRMGHRQKYTKIEITGITP